MGDMRIMLVDDNGDLRRGMRDYLARQEGMKVVAECPSGAEALEALGKVRVDVMVLDLIMPQMDGFALMEEVRRQQLANPPQIIVVSALGRDDFIMRAVQLGARFYMVKPFDMASLAARIRESCGQGVALVVLRHLHDEQVHRALLVIIQLAEVEDEAEFCIRQVRGDEFACRRVMTDKIVDGHAEVVRNAGQNGNVRLGIAVLILVDGLLADLNEISQSALAQTLSGTERLQIREHSKEQPPVI